MEKTKRQSNFELLRIFAMLLIILFHVQAHGPEQLLTPGGNYFTQPIIYLRLLILEFGSLFGPIGNGLFIMISGYFMNSNLNIDTGKIAKKLLLQLGFSVTVLIIMNAAWLAFCKNEELSLGVVVLADFNECWWFVGYYFFVIVLAKVFINKFTAKLTKIQFASLLLSILAVSQFAWSLQLFESLAPELRDLLIGIFFFLMGGYIAKYNPFKNFKAFTLFLFIAAAYGIRFLSAYNFVAGSIDEFIKSNSVEPFIPRIQKRWNWEIAVVIIVISLFELFRRLRVPKNAVINYIGKATLVIYFIHENSFFQMFYKDINWLELLSKSVLLYCLKWLKWTAIAFAVGLVAYGVYTLLGKLLPRIRSGFIVQEPGD